MARTFNAMLDRMVSGTRTSWLASRTNSRSLRKTASSRWWSTPSSQTFSRSNGCGWIRSCRSCFSKAKALAPRRWRLDSAGDGVVTADRHRITEAVMNLAHNAVQHTSEEDGLVLGSGIEDGEVRFWVHDTGVGIEPAEQPRIFGRMKRGCKSYRRYRGSGLGLAIVQSRRSRWSAPGRSTSLPASWSGWAASLRTCCLGNLALLEDGVLDDGWPAAVLAVAFFLMPDATVAVIVSFLWMLVASITLAVLGRTVRPEAR